jgi:hypothetical protein
VNLALQRAARDGARKLGMSQSAFELHVGDLQAVVLTLTWIERNASVVKAAVEAEAKKTEVAAP